MLRGDVPRQVLLPDALAAVGTAYARDYRHQREERIIRARATRPRRVEPAVCPKHGGLPCL